MREGIPEALVERMVAHFRAVDAKYKHVKDGHPALNAELAEVRAILAELPDPDMVEAREAVCRSHHDKHPESPWHIEQAALVRSGQKDQMLDVLAAYEGIKRGRQLERPSA